MDLTSISKYFICFGIFFLLIGGVLYFASKLGIEIGKLPGDILVQKENFTFYFPVATCIIISVILTVVFSLLSKK